MDFVWGWYIYTKSMAVVAYILERICISHYIKNYVCYIHYICIIVYNIKAHLIDFFSTILLFMMDIWKAYSDSRK